MATIDAHVPRGAALGAIVRTLALEGCSIGGAADGWRVRPASNPLGQSVLQPGHLV
jgi:hypothetical protein